MGDDRDPEKGNAHRCCRRRPASAEERAGLIVVKVGGSLFDLPDLASRLRLWLDELPPCGVLLVPGGGRLADVIRSFDAQHGLGESLAHELALGAMSLNARLLAALLSPQASLVNSWSVCPAPWRQGKVGVADALCFLQANREEEDGLPHSWGVTCDSIAAHLALRGKAAQLILLKSITIPEHWHWTEAARRGYVDDYFVSAVRRLDEESYPRCLVRAVNFREWRPSGKGDGLSTVKERTPLVG